MAEGAEPVAAVATAADNKAAEGCMAVAGKPL